MNTIKAIMSRRSIRKFTDQKIPDELLKTILETAMNAPSAGDARPWHFVVIRKRETLDQLADRIDDGNDLFKQAQAAILIVGDPSKEGFPGFYPQDCSCAAQNIYLATHELGLGTVWIATWEVPPRVKGIREMLGIPEDLMPFAIFPLGFPGEKLDEEYRYDEKMLHYEKWGEQK